MKSANFLGESGGGVTIFMGFLIILTGMNKKLTDINLILAGIKQKMLDS